jgi:hypothetical protein
MFQRSKVACCRFQTEQDVKAITKLWEKRALRARESIAFIREARVWLDIKDEKLNEIKTRFSRELQRLRNMQQIELAERQVPGKLESSSQAVLPESKTHTNQSNLTSAFAKVLEFHSEKASPADCPFLRGYGDVRNIESTRSEKSGSKDWNLLGLRGTEAIQVSSHRGPPTDRPPDIPTVETNGFAGCSEERPNTRHFHQLASFARSSHCLSGNASPLAANAFMGIRAIEQYCVCAVGTSQRSQSGAELDASEVWSVQGQRDSCVTNCHPSSNLGRNLFPPRRFSYHTRFSRFNGTARQPSPDMGAWHAPPRSRP